MIGILITFLFLLTACEDSESALPDSIEYPPPSESDQSQDSGDIINEPTVVTPLIISNGEDVQFIDWISNEEVIYISSYNGESSINLYNLVSGENNPLFITQGFIQIVEVSPDKEQLLVQVSSMDHEATLHILALNGKQLSTINIPSSEIYLDWNEINPSQILVTSFSEDWSFQSYVWNIETSELTTLQMEQPFSEWIGENALQYLDWNVEQPELLAPLKRINLDSNEISVVTKDIYFTKSYGDWFLTLSPSSQNEYKGVYQFYNATSGQIGSFTAFHLNRFSEWVVPYHEFVEAGNRFYFFQPLEGGDIDFYEKDFVLSSYSLTDGETNIVMEGLENKPIQCSPNGSYCLYGYQLEQVISIQNGEVTSLISEGIKKADAM